MAKKGQGLLSSFNEPSLPIDIVVHEFETKPVDVDALRTGMVRFRFLLHGSQPGSVPDPKILASMLDLVSFNLLLPLYLVASQGVTGGMPQCRYQLNAKYLIL